MRLPWFAVALTALLLITAALAVDPIRDAATGAPVPEVTLTAPGAYLLFAPLSTMFDTLTLLTVAQHIALVVWAILVFAGIRIWRARTRGTSLRRELTSTALFLLGLVGSYAVAVLLPRPMARLVTSDSLVLIADFHSHTKYSHDGRSGWDADDVRRWYGGAGFDVAYVTDHRTLEGAERAVASNAGQAGENTMLLQGIEAYYKGEHVNVLSAGRRYRGILDDSLKDVDSTALRLANFLPATVPTLIETVPGKLDRVPSIAATNASPGVVAIEVIDGSPRGLSQTRAQRARILHLADSLNLALVTGSDNHGWGNAAAGWTLMRIPGWRGMPTDSLSAQIEYALKVGRRESTRVAERRIAGATNPLSVALTPVLVIWRMLTTLSADLRVVWLVWTWALVVLARALRNMRSNRAALTT